MSTRVQSAETRKNIEKARQVWRAKQIVKEATAEGNREARAARGDKGQLALLDKLGLRAVKERAKLAKRIADATTG